MLEATKVSKRFGGRTVLENVSLQVRPQQTLTLIGPNGSGKTTLVRVLLGLEAPDSGSVARKPNLKVGYVPQRVKPEPTFPITAQAFLQMHAHRHKPEVKAVQAIAGELGVAHTLGTQLCDVSGGELQRLLLARALLCQPELLVLDEPVQGVDVTGQAQLYALIAAAAKTRNLAVLMVSHDLHLVMATTDEVICLNKHICCAGHPHAVAEDPQFAALFGPAIAQQFAIYQHQHDHVH